MHFHNTVSPMMQKICTYIYLKNCIRYIHNKAFAANIKTIQYSIKVFQISKSEY